MTLAATQPPRPPERPPDVVAAEPRLRSHPIRQLRRRAPVVTAISVVVALALLLPLVYLLIAARQTGWATIQHLLFRPLSAELLRNTVELSILVVTFAAVIATFAAWCVERTKLPGRQVWTVLLVLPVAIPDFVVGYAWHSLVPGLVGLPGATLVMTFTVYPLIYLPVIAALRRADPALEETARSLGYGRMRTFTRAVLPQIRPALLGGCLVVTLVLLAEFGAFEIMNFRTFTTVIFSEFQVDAPAAYALSLVLVVLGLLVLVAEAAATGGGRISRSGPQAARPPLRYRLGRATVPVLAALVALVVVALGVPLGTLAYWLSHQQHSTLPASATLAEAAATTAKYAAVAALIATAAALPVALVAIWHRNRVSILSSGAPISSSPCRASSSRSRWFRSRSVMPPRFTRPGSCWSSPTA